MINLTGDLTSYSVSQIKSQSDMEVSSRCKKDGKFNKAAIMRQAWNQARTIASVFGRSAKEFFAAQLKSVWAVVKGL